MDDVLNRENAQEWERRLAQERDRLGMLLEINNALVSNRELPGLFDDIAGCLQRVVAHDLTALLSCDDDRNGSRAFRRATGGPSDQHGTGYLERVEASWMTPAPLN